MELKKSWLWGVVPALLALAVYAPASGFGFVNYDDSSYFYENPQVLGGLTPENARWAFGIHGPSMWIPLTWLSHQAMVSVFGPEAGPHHVLNLLLHALNSALIVVWLSRATESRWLALGVASVFAVHPIHVESVAWVTERKDVLSMGFCLLALIAHERRARGGGWGSWVAMFGCHALAVMAKPLAVTLPCAMLLLDAWPYRRRISWGVVGEKLPLLGMSALASWLTVLCQNTMGAIASGEDFPLPMRLANAAVSYATYVRRVFLPDDLMAHYPYPDAVPALSWIAALALLGVISWGAWRLRRAVPAVGIGWLWFLGTLVPMIGLVQAGGSAMANRYAYLSFIGLYLALFAGLGAAMKRWPEAKPYLAGAVGAALVVLTGLGREQVGVWRDSESLFRHAIGVSETNHLAHNNLGLALEAKGRPEEARRHYLAALAARPSYAQARNNLGILAARAGRPGEAAALLEQVVAQDANHAIAWHNLGKVRAGLGRPEAARDAFRRAIEASPDFVMPRYDLAGLEISLGHWEPALEELDALLDLSPDHANAWLNRGFALAKLGRAEQAVEAYRRADRLGAPQAVINLAALLEEEGRLDEALEVALDAGDPGILFRLAAALREKGQLDGARRALERCLALQPGSADAHNDLGVVLGMLEDPAAAEGHFLEALRLRPDHPTAAANLRQAREDLGR